MKQVLMEKTAGVMQARTATKSNKTAVEHGTIKTILVTKLDLCSSIFIKCMYSHIILGYYINIYYV